MCGPTVGAAQRLAGQEQNLCGCGSSLIAFQQLSCLNEKKNVFFFLKTEKLLPGLQEFGGQRS